jgi:hypothetical protein
MYVGTGLVCMQMIIRKFSSKVIHSFKLKKGDKKYCKMSGSMSYEHYGAYFYAELLTNINLTTKGDLIVSTNPD